MVAGYGGGAAKVRRIRGVRLIVPYGPVLSDAQARAELRRCAGTQFDPTVVAVFCARSAPRGSR